MNRIVGLYFLLDGMKKFTLQFDEVGRCQKVGGARFFSVHIHD